MTTDYDTKIAELQNTLADALTRIAQLEDATRPAKKLPVLQTLTTDHCNRIVKLRADLFHNQIARQGTPKHVLKLFVWLDHKDGKSGHIKPLHFWLYPADRLDPNGDNLLARLVRECEPGWFAGCLTHKTKGTTRHKDHVAIRADDSLIFRVGDHDSWAFDSHQELKPSEDGKSPIARWYLELTGVTTWGIEAVSAPWLWSGNRSAFSLGIRLLCPL